MLPPSCLRQKAGLNVSILRRQTVVCPQLLMLEKMMQKCASRNTGRLAGEGHGTVIAPKDEVEDNERRHDAKYTRQAKIKPVLHHEEREQAFKHLIETWSVPSRDHSQTALDEARHAIPQQDRESKHQPRCHIKTFDPRARARDQDRKQVASPGFGRSQQGTSIQKTQPAIQGRGEAVP